MALRWNGAVKTGLDNRERQWERVARTEALAKGAIQMATQHLPYVHLCAGIWCSFDYHHDRTKTPQTDPLSNNASYNSKTNPFANVMTKTLSCEGCSRRIMRHMKFCPSCSGLNEQSQQYEHDDRRKSSSQHLQIYVRTQFWVISD